MAGSVCNRRGGLCLLILAGTCLAGCQKGQQTAAFNPFMAPDVVPPPGTRAPAPGEAQPYYPQASSFGQQMPAAGQAVAQAAPAATSMPAVNMAPAAPAQQGFVPTFAGAAQASTAGQPAFAEQPQYSAQPSAAASSPSSIPSTPWSMNVPPSAVQQASGINTQVSTTPDVQQALWQSAPPTTQPASHIQATRQPAASVAAQAPQADYPAARSAQINAAPQEAQKSAYDVAQSPPASPQARTMSVVLSPVGEGRPQVAQSREAALADSGFSQPGMPASATSAPLSVASRTVRADFNVAGPNGIDPASVPTLSGSVSYPHSSAAGVVWRKPGVDAESDPGESIHRAAAAPAQFQASAAPYAAPAYAAVPQGANPAATQAAPVTQASQFVPSASHLPMQPGGVVQTAQITSLAP